MKLTPSLARYVLAIDRLGREGKARQVDVSLALEVSKASVSKAVHRLVEAGLIEPNVKGGLHLTVCGRERAAQLAEEQRRLVQVFERVDAPEYVDLPCAQCPLACF